MSPQNGAAIDITLREINEWAREPGKATYRDQLSREPNSERMHDGPKSQQTQDQYKHLAEGMAEERVQKKKKKKNTEESEIWLVQPES